MKRFSRRGIPLPPLRPEWDQAIPHPPESAGPEPVGGGAWYNEGVDADEDFSFCAVSPRTQREFDEAMSAWMAQHLESLPTVDEED